MYHLEGGHYVVSINGSARTFLGNVNFLLIKTEKKLLPQIKQQDKRKKESSRLYGTYIWHFTVWCSLEKSTGRSTASLVSRGVMRSAASSYMQLCVWWLVCAPCSS